MDINVVRDFLQHHFDGMEANLEKLSSGRVSGQVIWAGFEGQDQYERQGTVREALHHEFEADVQSIGVLLTYTPNEIEEMVAA